ncbi:DUF2845 domain-containing protein [Methylophaga sp. OBS4]|uniref:DUF2845 domain-containing protein n=1 Tax=Methylophaga sp. OBS4 TaxID=2991935 RepID=UPI003A4C741E|nr:DUF2845 domain-containing protein [Methylophaga sp. OBS4]
MARTDSHSYRCGNSLVSVGDSLYEVQDVCGPSDGVYRWTESRASGSFSRQGGDYQARSDAMERHTYSEYGKFDTYLIFRNGNLEKIVQGRR